MKCRNAKHEINSRDENLRDGDCGIDVKLKSNACCSVFLRTPPAHLLVLSFMFLQFNSVHYIDSEMHYHTSLLFLTFHALSHAYILESVDNGSGGGSATCQ